MILKKKISAFATAVMMTVSVCTPAVADEPTDKSVLID